MDTTINDLIGLIWNQAEPFRVQFMSSIEIWASEQVIRHNKRMDKYENSSKINLSLFYGYSSMDEYYAEQKHYYSAPSWHSNEAEFVRRSLIEADKHYENAIEKLARAICKKGLNLTAIRIVSAIVGVNLDIVLTDGEKTVRAYTIIASGCVQRPHYRYLVK